MKKRLEKVVNITHLKRVCSVIIIVVLGYVILSLALGKDYSLEKNGASGETLPASPPSLFSQNKEIKDYSGFIAEIGQKEIFAVSASEEMPATPQVEQDKLAKIKDNLRVLGIITSQPQKAIIEDAASGRTYEVKENDVFLENIKVEKIDKNTVILNLYGESFELYL